MSRRAMAMLASVAALAVLVMGCGGGDDEPLTKAEFIEQGDQICKEARAQVTENYKVYAEENGIEEGEFPTRKQGHEVTEAIYLPTVEERIEGLRELSPPEGDEKTIEKMLAATEDGLAKAEEDIELLFEFGNSPFDEANEIAQDYGFKVCGTT